MIKLRYKNRIGEVWMINAGSHLVLGNLNYKSPPSSPYHRAIANPLITYQNVTPHYKGLHKLTLVADVENEYLRLVNFEL